jgi:hypothetical protein
MRWQQFCLEVSSSSLNEAECGQFKGTPLAAAPTLARTRNPQPDPLHWAAAGIIAIRKSLVKANYTRTPRSCQ